MDLPDTGIRHEWLRYEQMGLIEAMETDYLRRLRDIYYRKVFKVPMLDFGSLGLIDGVNAVGGMRDRLEMIHRVLSDIFCLDPTFGGVCLAFRDHWFETS